MCLQLPVLLLAALLLFSACNKKEGTDFDGPETKIRAVQSEKPTIKESEQLAAQIESELNLFAQRIVSGDLPDLFSDNAKWSQLSNRFLNSSEQSRNVKVSVFEIKHEGSTVQTVARMEMKARLNNQNYFGLIIQFESSWSKNEDGQLKVLEIGDPEQIVLNESPVLWFSDETDRLTAKEPTFAEHLSRGLDFWLKRIESIHGIDAFINNGMALGDFDGDGRDDIYVCQPGGLPNRLFLHQADNTIQEAPKKTGANYLDHTSAALFIDIDNDGDQDLTLATPSGIVLLENDKHQSFIERGILQTDEVDCHSLSATDFDLDGNLDLLITFALGSRSLDDDSSFRFDDARDGGSNQLFKGDGKWSFSEVTALSGLSEG
ncbi:MAG: VCBS repeat-containing protein, partial [Verrucomicrobiota bacterium]|nr:VCBS repeat-containing protein [Verrucomicrobiota bacterium]